MTVAKSKPVPQTMTLEEYLVYDDGTDARDELVDRILVDMGAESDINVMIAGFLVSVLLQYLPHYCIRRGTQVLTAGM